MQTKITVWTPEGHKEVEVNKNTRLFLGCDDGRTVVISDWMEEQEIQALEEMAEYIDNLDFSVKLA